MDGSYWSLAIAVLDPNASTDDRGMGAATMLILRRLPEITSRWSIIPVALAPPGARRSVVPRPM
jgi:hypothetical protein